MYLKRVEIHGFKSFAEKTKVVFEKGVTVIVGPNGTGKSNITDAIRWVLGEQSVKSLRGNKMEDVIFSGSKSRKASKIAEVSIILDNSKKIFPIDFEELSISRRVFRTGESEYYINKAPCKLKDIRELFMDTGIGKDGYSIIGQGQVDKILSSKSEDRRNIFEEAAGIVKYKTRREESEKKLEKTKNNMVRIEDILLEIKHQLTPLENQSKNATEYMSLKEQLTELEIGYIYNKTLLAEKNKLEANKEQIKLMEKEKFNFKTREDLKEEIELKKKYILNIKTRISEIERNNLINSRKKDENNTKINILKNDSKNIEENINKEKIYIVQNIKKIDKYKTDIDILDSEVKEQEILLKEQLAKKTKIELEYENNKNEKTKKDNLIKSEKDKVFYMLNKTSEIKSNMNNIVSFQSKLKEQDLYFKKEMEEIEKRIREIKISKKENVNNVQFLEKGFFEQKEKLKELQEKHYENNEKTENTKSILKDSQINKKGLESELRLLSDFKERHEGYNKGVKDFLNYCKKNNLYERGIEGVLGDLISTNKEYEKAIEISLGYGIQSIIVENPTIAKKSIELLKKHKLGRLTFLPMSTMDSKELNVSEKEITRETGVIGVASDIVKSEKKYRKIIDYFLGRVLIVDNIDTMIRITKDKNIKYKIITLEGDVYSPGGSMTGGETKNSKVSFLSRDRKIKELKENIFSLERTIDKSEKEIKTNIELMNETEKNIEDNKQNIEKISREIEKINNLDGEHKTEIRNLDERRRKILLEIEKVKIETNSLDDDYSKSGDELHSLEKDLDILKSKVEDINLDIEDKEDKIEELKEKLQEKELLTRSTEQRLKNILKEKENNILDIQNIENFISYNKKNIEKLELNKKKIQEEVFELKIEVEKLELKIKTSLTILNKINIVRDREEKELDDNIDRRNKLTEEDFEIKSELVKISSKVEKYSQEIETHLEYISDAYNLSYFDLSISPNNENFNINIEKDIKKIKRKLEVIGNVNVDSIKEFKTLKERYEFLKKQKEDLEKAEISLKKVILELNKKMKVEFLDKFNNIRKEFKEIFKELFGGGEGDIFLNDEEDILNTGIEIVAQPPGKSRKPLSLLSGGERALTAIAVLFSILRIKPTPFCILDEIESALDEANVYRYGEFLKDFSKETQFIVVTHRKGTMESGDILYGVTMENEGVSKIISVKLSEEFIKKLN